MLQCNYSFDYEAIIKKITHNSPLIITHIAS